ncbi:alpha/beta hydrolase [Streptomyces puniciscabiei]|uniref:alpha/beta hydrolase n=1 Tax=Streptomyces puniciscabiei TaxID=164348 RepID=UPI0033280F69
MAVLLKGHGPEGGRSAASGPFKGTLTSGFPAVSTAAPASEPARFDKFLDGLDASHTGDTHPHRTVIAHSYGTTLVGAAARTGHVSADDLVFAGSPGVKVSSADELDVPKGHVWNEEADGDVVPDIGRWGHDGDRFIIPSDPEFGANEMTTDTEGHSGYWDERRPTVLHRA